MGIFSKQANESFESYCHRLAQMKYSQQLTWQEIASIVADETGIEKPEGYYRKKEAYYKKKTGEYIVDDECPVVLADEELESIIKIQKAKAQLSDERVQVNALIRRLSREDNIKDIAKEAAFIMSEKLPLLSQKENIETTNIYNINDRQGLLLISDWHYGVSVDNFYNVFNPEVCKYRVNKLKEKVTQDCILNGVEVLNIANLGDMIAGRIHLPLRINSRVDVITQIMEVSEILAEFIYELSKNFTINYFSVNDNHSRIEPNKNDSIDLESLYRITDWYLRSRLENCANIRFHDNEFGDDIATTNIFDYNIGFVHGHKDSQSTILTKLNNFTKIHFDLVCSAHMHHFSSDEDCDTFMIANGGLMGTDDYAFNKRLTSVPSQTLIIISEENITEAIYRITL